MRRVRPAVYVFGVALAVGSLLGARALTAGNNGGDQPKTANPAGNGKATGPVVLGTVDSDPQPVEYRLPPVLQSGTVVEVIAKDGLEVKAGDKLYEFDSAIQRHDLAKAKVAVKMAQNKVEEAKEGEKQHAKKVEVTRQGVDLAKTKADLAGRQYHLIKNNIFSLYKAEKYDPMTWDDRLKDDPKAFDAQSAWNLADGEWKLKKAELAVLETADATLLVKQAETGVKLAEEEQAKAQTAVDLCIVRAKTAGTVEQVTISPGTTLGVGTRAPALWLIPAGPRVVRAEVEPDFAHRVSNDLIGKEVTVYDNTDPKLTYKGTVRRIGSTFLLKRSSSDALLGNDTRVLEAVVEIADPAPAGRPPLRVGQRVRVNLGQ
jgi:multidrug resistance efflux pump